MINNRITWENFHRTKARTGMALEWPDEFVVRFAKSWKKTGDIHRVLDLNCGAGRHTMLLARMGFEVVGVDLSMLALKQAVNLLNQNSVSGHLVSADSMALPFGSATFDALVAWRSLHVFAHKTIYSVIAEMRRVLKPNGYILISTRSNRNKYAAAKIGTTVSTPTDLSLQQLQEVCAKLNVLTIDLSESTANNRQLCDSYWVVFACC